MRAAETKEGTCAGAAQENAEGSAAERNDQQVAPAMRQLQESSKKQFVAGYETSGNSRRAATHPRLSISGDVDIFVREKENFDEIKKNDVATLELRLGWHLHSASRFDGHRGPVRQSRFTWCV